MTQSLVFDPLLPQGLIWALAGLGLALLVLALWRGLSGWALRALALGFLLAALSGPSLQDEERKPLSDIVLLAVDDSASQALGDRKAQTAEALDELTARLKALPNTEVRLLDVGDGAGNAGTLAMAAIAEALAEEPRGRVAGVILLSDGQVHDAGAAPDFPAPFQLVLTGRATDWDRRLVITSAPAFAILGEEVMLNLRIEDQGAVPGEMGGAVELTVALDAEAPISFTVPVGQDLSLPVRLPHAGMNVLHLSVGAEPGELTDRNNAAVVQINGVRDRLRVLLVSGEPHAGERVWRNLLKSDPSVDLVHFTILRPPEKQDNVPVSELSLIAFPTRELFVDKIKDFDLIIFDRYRMRGILPMSYIDNVVSYVREGGTVLVAAGPEFGEVDSLWRSPLAAVLPVEPSSRIIEGAFRPEVTALGDRHPVTEGLGRAAPEGGWGRWLRLMEVTARRGQVVMSGTEGLPLLVLDRVGEGRVAVLASDQAWLWGRGHEGGGPQLELLRRLAHWMLKEPELEEENLAATVTGQVVTLTRRTILDSPPPEVVITAPDGREARLSLNELGPGKFQADWTAPDLGLYRLSQGDLKRVVAVGPAAPREFEAALATGAVLDPVAKASRGGVTRLEAGMPDIRLVREGRVAVGRGWIGLTPRGGYETGEVRIAPFLPAWAWALLALASIVAAWLVEGRRRGGSAL